MSRKMVNIMEDIVGDLCDRLLALRFDICKCDICIAQMKFLAVGKFPPTFVNRSQSDYRLLYVQLTNQYFNKIISEVTNAINQVTKNPPHKVEADPERGFAQLVERIYQDRGLDFSQYHDKILKRRVEIGKVFPQH